MKFTILIMLKGTIQWFSVPSQCCKTITTNSRYSHHPQKKPYTHYQSLSIPPILIPWQQSVFMHLPILDISCDM